MIISFVLLLRRVMHNSLFGAPQCRWLCIDRLHYAKLTGGALCGTFLRLKTRRNQWNCCEMKSKLTDCDCFMLLAVDFCESEIFISPLKPFSWCCESTNNWAWCLLYSNKKFINEVTERDFEIFVTFEVWIKIWIFMTMCMCRVMDSLIFLFPDKLH